MADARGLIQCMKIALTFRNPFVCVQLHSTLHLWPAIRFSFLSKLPKTLLLSCLWNAIVWPQKSVKHERAQALTQKCGESGCLWGTAAWDNHSQTCCRLTEGWQVCSQAVLPTGVYSMLLDLKPCVKTGSPRLFHVMCAGSSISDISWKKKQGQDLETRIRTHETNTLMHRRPPKLCWTWWTSHSTFSAQGTLQRVSWEISPPIFLYDENNTGRLRMWDSVVRKKLYPLCVAKTSLGQYEKSGRRKLCLQWRSSLWCTLTSRGSAPRGSVC